MRDSERVTIKRGDIITVKSLQLLRTHQPKLLHTSASITTTGTNTTLRKYVKIKTN